MNSQKIRRMTITSVLMALIILLGLTPIGFINVGVIYITFLCVPVIIGALSLGAKSGLILGVCMGSVSLYTGLRAPSALVAPILQNSVVWVILMCYVPRLAVPLVAAGVRKALEKRRKKAAVTVAAAAGSLTNTVLYLGLMLFFYQVIGINHPALLGTLGTIVLTAGLPEAAAAAILSTPILFALEKSGLIGREKKQPQ